LPHGCTALIFALLGCCKPSASAQRNGIVQNLRSYTCTTKRRKALIHAYLRRGHTWQSGWQGLRPDGFPHSGCLC
jgi:hypothetical protein